MEMLRSTIRTAFRSFRMMGRLPEENGGPSVVHLRFKMRFYYEIIWEDRRELSYIGEETSSFSVNLNNLRTVEDITPLVLQHLSNSECEEVLLFIDDITLVMSDMIYHVVGNRPSDLQPAEPLAISLSLDVTYHDEIESWEVAAMDMEDQLFLDHSQLVFEPVRRPASKASIDALERKKAEEQQEESLENVCVVCQDEVGRTGDFIAKLPCSHEFHEDCVLAWLERAHSCPLCRYQLPTD